MGAGRDDKNTRVYILGGKIRIGLSDVVGCVKIKKIGTKYMRENQNRRTIAGREDKNRTDVGGCVRIKKNAYKRCERLGEDKNRHKRCEAGR